MNWDHLQNLARRELDATLAELPAPLRERARQIPIALDRQPGAEFVADGIGPETLGLFTGPAFGDADHAASPVPAQIFLFLANLWNYVGGNETAYRAEVRTTYLHELGHYLGLDEDELTDRGLG
ncbi:MAG TPA: metallopeptidase family protein [Verrucomicrobiota bacterium]|nr:metallopeptidase family protein [Verrucomicrobiota bacterium]HNT13284.1 metallopeptidase family protein [Verrucomicrobiota bacterium]